MSDPKPEKGTDRLKAKEPEQKTPTADITKRYPFLFNNQETKLDSPTAPAYEARNKDGDTFQVIPLSPDEVEALASQGLLQRAVTVGKDFSYDDLKNLNEGEIILATLPKK